MDISLEEEKNKKLLVIDEAKEKFEEDWQDSQRSHNVRTSTKGIKQSTALAKLKTSSSEDP